MNTFARALQQHTDLSVEAQIQAGKPLEGKMPPAHIAYLKQLVAAIDGGTYTPDEPRSLVSTAAYDAAPEVDQGKIDLVLPTIADAVRHTVMFYRNPATPNACPQLKTMIDHLWEMLGRLGPTASLLMLPSPPRA